MNLDELLDSILKWREANPHGSKRELAAMLVEASDLKLDKALLVGSQCVLRISQMEGAGNASNALAAFHKICDHDDKPFVVCLLTKKGMRLMLANTSCIATVSDRSYKIRTDNLVGGVLESDLVEERDGVANRPENFAQLWAAHTAADHTAEIERIVAATRERHASEAAANPGRVK